MAPVYVGTGGSPVQDEDERSSATSLHFADSRPFLIKSCTVIERLLRPHSRGGKPGVKVSALNRFPLRQAFAKKSSKAANESVTGPGAVHAFHAESGHVLHTLASGQQ